MIPAEMSNKPDLKEVCPAQAYGLHRPNVVRTTSFGRFVKQNLPSPSNDRNGELSLALNSHSHPQPRRLR
jgi:hypothetical protein